MASPKSRLRQILDHFLPSSASPTAASAPSEYTHKLNYHTLSPTYFLPRAAAIEPEALAVHHETSNGKTMRRTYAQVADRARGFAYYLRKHNLKRVGILAPNTPAFLESIFGIAAANAVSVGVNYRLKSEDVTYIFEHAEVDAIVVDAEFVGLLHRFPERYPQVQLIVDTDTDVFEGPDGGEYNQAIQEGLVYDRETGGKGWSGLTCQTADEESVIALAYTSGTTARPKGVEYTHRGCYLAALANVIESGLNISPNSCGYLWTLPMFHATGWTFPWSITAVRGTHYCLRKIDYPKIWSLLKNERITHFNAAPTVNTLLCADENASRLDHPVRVTVAASPPTAHLFKTMEELNLNPVHVYGLTETYGPITKGYILPTWSDLDSSDRFSKMARQGHGFVTSEAVRVIKTTEDDGNPSPEHFEIEDVAKNGREIGEIVFTGNICAKGYYKDPEATRKLFKGGVLHSGDLAVWHEDGAIQILDRAKDIIISGGENISSVALESILVQHPSILEAGVVAIPDEKFGERPKAFVTVRSSCSSSQSSSSRSSETLESNSNPDRNPSTKVTKGAITGEEIIKWARENDKISRFMVPAQVEIVSELPKTSTGKIRKNVLREWARGSGREGME